jgi:hypothetical protein
MDEHDDDLEPEVLEDAPEEVETFPDGGDELDESRSEDAPEKETEKPNFDEDESEL